MTDPPVTYAYLLTPHSAGAIAVTRIVGHQSQEIAARVLRTTSGEPLTELPDGKVFYGHVVEGDDLIDDVVASRVLLGDMPAVDICSHGNPRVVSRLSSALERAGATTDSQPENPRIWRSANRIEADVDLALATAKTDRAVRFLAWQRQHLARALEDCAMRCAHDVEQARAKLSAIQQRSAGGTSLVDGATVTLVGPPNSGKSTLFNRLVGRPSALVSATPGTTRDWVSQPIELDGVPIDLIDTAGRHDTADMLERRAIDAGIVVDRRAKQSILVLDASLPADKDIQTCESFRSAASGLVVLNKTDQVDGTAVLEEIISQTLNRQTVAISALTGAGIDDLTGALAASLGVTDDLDREATCFSTRQVQLLSDILEDLSAHPDKVAGKIRANLIGLRVDFDHTEGLQ